MLFPTFLSAIRKSLSDEDVVAYLRNRGRFSKEVWRRHKKRLCLLLNSFLGVVLATLRTFHYLHLHINKLRFMQERTAETKIQPKINSTLKELGL
jgi:hypothetical protein